eukprot:2445979-Amphidinium_carterae.1
MGKKWGLGDTMHANMQNLSVICNANDASTLARVVELQTSAKSPWLSFRLSAQRLDSDRGHDFWGLSKP